MALPASLNIVASVDTTGVAPGPHGDVKGTTIIFDLDDEANGYAEERDLSEAERFAEKAAAGGTEEYQEEHADESRVASGNQTPPMTSGAPQVESPDTTDTATGGDVPVAYEETEKDPTGVQQVEETTGTVGRTVEPQDVGVTESIDTTDTGGKQVAAQNGEEPLSTDAGEGQEAEDLDSRKARLDSELTLPKLAKLAKAKEVEVEGTHKADFVDALAEAGITADDYDPAWDED